MNVEIAATIAVVVIVAIFLAKRVGFRLDKDGVSLSANKSSEKDTVSAKKIQQSNLDITNREGQNVNVEDVSDHSDVKIR